MTKELLNQQQEDLSIGKIFQLKREFLKIEKEAVCSFFRIKMKDIDAIENDDFSGISSHLYSIGLIRSYANFLKIDPEIIEKKIKNISIKSNTENKKHLLINIGENLELTPDKNMFFNLMMISILLFLVFLSFYNSFEDKSSLISNQEIISEFQNIDS